MTLTGRVPTRERRRVQERLERRAGLPPAAPRAVELRFAEVAAADHRENVPRGGIDGHERRLQAAIAEPAQTVVDRALRRVLQLRDERRLHLPVGRMVAAEPIAELLAQELLRVAVPRVDRAGERTNARPGLRGGALLDGRDVVFLAHPLQHDVAALDGPVVVRPRRQRGGRADQSGDNRRFRQRQPRGGFSIQVFRHRLDAVHAAAQVHAVQIELEDLLLRELLFEEQRKNGFLGLAHRRPLVRQEQRARQLLRERAAAFQAAAAACVAPHRARRPDRVDAEMVVEAVIFDCDDGVFQRGRDLIQRDVVPLLVHPEPRLAAGRIEPRVAHAAAQLVHRPALPHRPDDADGGDPDERQIEPGGDAVFESGLHRWKWSHSESTM